MNQGEQFEAWFKSDPDCMLMLTVYPQSLEFKNGAYVVSATNKAWCAWQVARPEHYVLVPMELSNSQARTLATNKLNQDINMWISERRGYTAIQLEQAKDSWIGVQAIKLQAEYKTMVQLFKDQN